MSDEPRGEAAIESTAEEMGEHDDGPGTELAVMPAGGGQIIRAEQPEEILQKATTIANALKGLIEAQGLAVNVGGRRKHVEVGGWQALGSLLGALGGEALHAETIWTRPVPGADGTPQVTKYTAEVKHYEGRGDQRRHARTTTYEVDGLDWEACVEVRTASGIVVGKAEAMCGRAEEKWSKRDDYALRSMAETRAESRAYRRAVGWIVNIAGYSPTPAEEMPGQDAEPTGPPFGPAVDEAAKQGIMLSLRRLVAADGEDIDAAQVKVVAQAIARDVAQAAGGYMPAIVGAGLVRAANGRLAHAANATTNGAPEEKSVVRHPSGSLEATEENVREWCDCPEGSTSDTCPINGHGIPF